MEFNIRTKVGLYKFFKNFYPDRSMANDVKDILVNFTKNSPELTSKEFEEILKKIVDNSRLRKSPIARKEDLKGIIHNNENSESQKKIKVKTKTKSKSKSKIPRKTKSKSKVPRKTKSKSKVPKTKSKSKVSKKKQN